MTGALPGVDATPLVAVPPSSVRLSKQTKDQIAQLKRRTGIKHMNVLCRWALCRSLAEPLPPSVSTRDTASDIDWKVFAGTLGDVWWLLVLQDAHERTGEAPDQDRAEGLLRDHIARGMSYLVGDQSIRDITALPKLAIGA
ncbi:MAG: hypothetical protein JWO62_1183 [Acidimicrobiaceae bacterium]|nr:hypothetical protein [Acidimicrobiaceae bacterium]